MNKWLFGMMVVLVLSLVASAEAQVFSRSRSVVRSRVVVRQPVVQQVVKQQVIRQQVVAPVYAAPVVAVPVIAAPVYAPQLNHGCATLFSH